MASVIVYRSSVAIWMQSGGFWVSALLDVDLKAGKCFIICLESRCARSDPDKFHLSALIACQESLLRCAKMCQAGSHYQYVTPQVFSIASATFCNMIGVNLNGIKCPLCYNWYKYSARLKTHLQTKHTLIAQSFRASQVVQSLSSTWEGLIDFVADIFNNGDDYATPSVTAHSTFH